MKERKKKYSVSIKRPGMVSMWNLCHCPPETGVDRISHRSIKMVVGQGYSSGRIYPPRMSSLSLQLGKLMLNKAKFLTRH